MTTQTTQRFVMLVALLALVACSGLAQAATGGPDSFGYSWADSNAPGGPSFDFVDISGTGTHFGLKKYQIEAVDLPFPFPFYGKTYNAVSLAYNGVLTFSPSTYQSVYFDGEHIPNNGSHGANLIAGLWDYLWPNVTCATKNVHYEMRGTAPNRTFIIQLTGVVYAFTSVENTFQWILHENGDIVINYKDVTVRDGRTTAGIENATGSVGLGYTPFDTPGHYTNLAVRYTTGASAPAQNGSVRVSLSPAGAVNAGAQWRLDGGAWQSSGATLTSVTAGSHTLSFASASGYQTPANQSITVTSGVLASQSVTYSATGTGGGTGGGGSSGSVRPVKVNITPANTVAAGAMWKIDDGDWLDSGTVVKGVSCGQHTLSFKPVADWTAPAPMTVNVVSNPLGAIQTYDITYTAGAAPAANLAVFPHVASGYDGWETEIGLINTGDDAINGSLVAYAADGSTLETKAMPLIPHGRMEVVVGRTFAQPDQIAYIDYQGGNTDLRGYEKFWIDDTYRASLPMATGNDSGDLVAPHIASDDLWWTGIALVNTNDTASTVTLTFNDGGSVQRTLAPHARDVFSIRDLFGGAARPGKTSAVISGAQGVIGLELFGNVAGGQLSGILLSGETAADLTFPYVNSDAGWWTGMVAYNPADAAASFNVMPYDANGNMLGVSARQIAPGQRFVGTLGDLDLPANTAWFTIESTGPITGFELFGSSDGHQLAGFSVVNIDATSGILPKIEHDGWTGIGFVNTGSASTTITLNARDNAGGIVATTQITLEPGHQFNGLAEDAFTHSLAAASYITFNATSPVIGFQINGCCDGWLLDALAAMR